MSSQEAPPDSSESQVPRCKLCNATDHRAKNCQEFAMVTDQAEERQPRTRKNPKPVSRRTPESKKPNALESQAASSRAEMGEIPGLTNEELHFLAKRRARRPWQRARRHSTVH